MLSWSSVGISQRGLSRVPTPALRDPQGVLGQKAAAMRLFVWAQVGRGAVEGAVVRLAVRAMATDMGWAAPMMRKATAMRFGGGTTHRKGASLGLEASDERFGVSVAERQSGGKGKRGSVGIVMGGGR